MVHTAGAYKDGSDRSRIPSKCCGLTCFKQIDLCAGYRANSIVDMQKNGRERRSPEGSSTVSRLYATMFFLSQNQFRMGARLKLHAILYDAVVQNR